MESIKAKIDTGARSSALHAFDLRVGGDGRDPWVSFEIHPHQRATSGAVPVQRHRIAGWRSVRSSDGAVQRRPFIVTRVGLGGESWPIELTLTDRDEMGFRMLLGRTAVRRRFLVDPSRSFLAGGRDGAR